MKPNHIIKSIRATCSCLSTKIPYRHEVTSTPALVVGALAATGAKNERLIWNGRTCKRNAAERRFAKSAKILRTHTGVVNELS